MTAEHLSTLLEAHLERRPFRPFVIELSTGERHEVDHPLACAFRGGVVVFLGPGTVPFWFDHESVQHIISTPASSSQEN